VSKSNPRFKSRRDYFPESILEFNVQLNNTSWESVYKIIHDENNPSQAYDEFAKIYRNAFDIHFPEKSIKKSHKMIPRNEWMTKGLMKSCITKSKLYGTYCKNKTEKNRKKYITYRNKLKILVRKAEQKFYSDKFTSAIGNIRETWKVINRAMKNKPKTDVPDHFIVNGVKVENKREIVNGFNDYFINIGAQLASSIPVSDTLFSDYLDSPNPHSFSLYPTDWREIVLIGGELNNKASFGCDLIPLSIVKSSISCIAEPMSRLINCSFDSGIFPEALKIGKVCPVFKNGDKSLYSNYRPISVLPSFSKIFEKAIHNRLTSFLKVGNILIDNQYGFRKNHSTNMAIIDLYDKISNAIDNNEFAITVFIDLAKAFDTLDHAILCDKLYYCGIRGIALDLFKSYLKNRSQFLNSYELSSESKNVTFGVPQGSILGPLLFIIYINDIVKCSSILRLILFADDTTLFHSDKDFDRLISVTNIELEKLAEWFKANKLSLNTKKTNFIIFGHKQQPDIAKYKLMLDGNCLERVKSAKFLGIYIDEKLNWNQHINHVCMKVSKGIGIMSRLKQIFPSSILLTLYESLIYPYLLYCCMVWGSAYLNALNSVIVLQNKAVRIITNSQYRSSAGPLFTRLKLLRFVDVYKFQVLLFVYQARMNMLPRSCMHYFVVNSNTIHNIRCTSYFKLFQYRTNIRKNCITIVGPKLWNSIPDSVKNSDGISRFKISLKSLLINKSE
jgi:Reverse transcriptase (RNA-dependent DNA polymerase)